MLSFSYIYLLYTLYYVTLTFRFIPLGKQNKNKNHPTLLLSKTVFQHIFQFASIALYKLYYILNFQLSCLLPIVALVYIGQIAKGYMVWHVFVERSYANLAKY